MTSHETEALGFSRRGRDWSSTSLVRLTQHLEHVEQPATRAALAALRDAASGHAEALDDAVARLTAAFVEHAEGCGGAAFPRICAWERARFGSGPWPPPDDVPLRERLVYAGQRATGVRRALDEVRSIERGTADAARARAFRDALGAFDAQLARELDLAALLFARAATLEPEL